MFTLPRPVSPKSALSDLREMLIEPRAHKWPVLGLSITLTAIILWGFTLDARQVADAKPQREIIYVQNWTADRKDSDILAQQKIDVARYEAALEAKQKEFQSVADRLGIEWRQDAERNRERRRAIIEAVNARIDRQIAQAKAREAAAIGAPVNRLDLKP